MWNGLDFDQAKSGVFNTYGQLQNKQLHVLLFDGIWYRVQTKAKSITFATILSQILST